MRRGSTSSRGIPDNLKRLAEAGERVRFNGFWLNESERDRTIAAWLDETDDAGSILKDLIYSAITGATVVQNLDNRQSDEQPRIGKAGSILADFED